MLVRAARGACSRLACRAASSAAPSVGVISSAESPVVVVAGAIVQRFPYVRKPLPDWAAERERLWRQNNDVANRKLPDEVYVDRRRAAAGPSDGSDKETKAPYWDRYAPAALQTSADASADRRSLQRALDCSLYLVARAKSEPAGGKAAWGFPKGHWRANETARATAERELREECGDTLKTYFLSNAPSVHFDYSDGGVAKRLFLYRAWYLGGSVSLNAAELADYAWLSKDECSEALSADLFAAVKDVLD